MLAILATHPIQYQVPIWKQLAERGKVPFEAWYLTAHGVQPTLDSQFGKVFKWDMDMLGQYPHRFPPEPVPQQLGAFWEVGLPADFRMRLKSGRVKALLVHGWNVRACWEAVFLAHHLGIETWIRGESNDLKRDDPLKGFTKRIVLGAFLRRIDRFLSIGRANTRLYKSYGVVEKQLRFSPYCIDNAHFAEQTEMLRPSRTDIRRAWGIPDDSFCVLFVGKYMTKKRPTDIIAALHILDSIDSTRRYHALFVGSGELGDTLRSQCRVVFDAESEQVALLEDDSLLSPAATFAGFMNQSEVSKAYVAADALVLPSDPNETWGLVVNEALASGLPCVVSDACGSAEDLIVPLDPKLRYPMGDQSELAHSIKHLADHPVSAHAIQSQISQYDFTATVETIEQLWSELSQS